MQDSSPRSFRLKPRLKEARLKQPSPVSQAQLGAAVAKLGLPGFKPTHVSLFELGYRDATWPEVEALAKVLKVAPASLTEVSPSAPAPAPVAKAMPAPIPAPAAAPVPVPAPSPVAPPPPATIGVGMAVKTQSAEPKAAPAPELRLPPAELPPLEPGKELVYRRMLADELAKANKTLDDRTLPAAAWREWKAYVQRLRAALSAVPM